MNIEQTTENDHIPIEVNVGDIEVKYGKLLYRGKQISADDISWNDPKFEKLIRDQLQ